MFIRLARLFLALLYVLPILPGLIAATLQAFGLMPTQAIGDGYAQLNSDPGYWPSIHLTLK